LYLTTDGGLQWVSRPLPVSLGLFYSLTCPSSTVCLGLTSPQHLHLADNIGPGPPIGVTFVQTDDAGLHWTSYELPSDASFSELSCPSATDCVTFGTTLVNGQLSESGVVLRTDDGGTTWTTGSLPSGFGFEWDSDFVCPDTLHCWAIGLVPSPPPPNTVSGGSQYMDSGVATSSDGGATWQVRALPSDVVDPILFSMSCPDASDCWISGNEEVVTGTLPAPTGAAGDGLKTIDRVHEVPLILVSHDGGSSWAVNLPTVPVGAPEDQGHDSYTGIGKIQCPTADACIALGFGDAGSAHTPVYTNQADPLIPSSS
jgi:hypothetical protein